MFLGIDIGTSKTAAAIVNPNGVPRAISSNAHSADLPSLPGFSEQDALVLLQSAWTAVRALPRDLRRSLRGVGVTGQMHGVVILDPGGEPLTPLITWRDGRCNGGTFLQNLNERTGAQLRTGYGCATLAWFASRGELPKEAGSAATIHDWIAARLCGASRPVTDPTDAASWGLFDLDTLGWNQQAVLAAGIPDQLLPEVVPCGSGIGVTSRSIADLLGVPTGIPVAAAMGDNQTSLVATLREPEKELSLGLGTGGQLSAVQPPGTPASETTANGTARAASWEYRPYPGRRLVAVAASLCGGSAWQWLADTVLGWMRDLALPAMPIETLFARLNDLADPSSGGIAVHPHFLGERHDPSRRASIEGITLDNLSLGRLARALARGICENLREMLPPSLRAGRIRIMASGNALDRNPLLRRSAEEVFGMPVVLGGIQEAAAVGAALNAPSSAPP
jgi:sedoheptulokinase